MSGDQAPPQGGDAVAVPRLCADLTALDNRRLRLDEELARRPENDPGREELWIELEDVAAAMPPLLLRLAAARSTGRADLRAKAGILSLMLRSGTDGFTTDVAALALSVAEEVASLA